MVECAMTVSHTTARQSLARWIQNNFRSTLAMTKKAGIPEATIRSFLNGNEDDSSIRLNTLLKIANAAGATVSELIGEINQTQHNIPLVGYVGGGEEIFPIDDGGQLEEIDITVATSMPMVAVRVRGNSMEPVYCPGDTLLYSRDHDGVPDFVVGHDCIVKISDDGPTLVKSLRHGKRRGYFDLVSHNPDEVTRYNQRLDWASPVRVVIRGALR